MVQWGGEKGKVPRKRMMALGVGERGPRKWRLGGARLVDHCDGFAFYLSAM